MDESMTILLKERRSTTRAIKPLFLSISDVLFSAVVLKSLQLPARKELAIKIATVN